MNICYLNPRLAQAGKWLLALLLLPTLAQASIVREAILDTETNAYAPPIPDLIDYHSHFATVATDAAPKLATDFSTLGETELTFTLSAPLGMRFHVSFPDAGSFSARYRAGNSFTVPGSASLTATISFAGFGGDAIAAPLTNQVDLTGPPFSVFSPDRYDGVAQWSLAAGTDFWFESLNITTLVPAGYATDLTVGPTPSAQLSGSIQTDYAADFGQFIFLEAIPSANSVPLPASWLLIGLGGLLLLRSRRHVG